jgi:hypothetical protein
MTTTPNLENWIKADSVRHDDTHSLRADRTLTPGETVKRNWRCTCGLNLGLLYDNAAKGAYRLHRKEAN